MSADLLLPLPAADRAVSPPAPAARPETNDASAFRDELDRATRGPDERRDAEAPRSPRGERPAAVTTDSDRAQAPDEDPVAEAGAGPGTERPVDEPAESSVDSPGAEPVPVIASAEDRTDPTVVAAEQLIAGLAGRTQAQTQAQSPGQSLGAPRVPVQLQASASTTAPASLVAVPAEASAPAQPGALPAVETPVASLERLDAGLRAAGREVQVSGVARQADPAALPVPPASQELPVGPAAETVPVTGAAVGQVRTLAPVSRGTAPAARSPAAIEAGLVSDPARESLDSPRAVDGAARPSAPAPAVATPVLDALGADVSPRTAVSPVASATVAAGGTEVVLEADDLNAVRLSRALNSAVKQNGGGLTLRLTPPELGTVRINLQLQGASVSADFLAESDAGGRLLTKQLTQLRSALENQGLTVERLGVQIKGQVLGGHQATQGEGQSTRQDNAPSDGRPGSQNAGGEQSRGRERGEAEAEARRGNRFGNEPSDESGFRAQLFGADG